MSKILTALIFLFSSVTVMSQSTGLVNGKLVDSAAKQSMKDASVTVLNAKDSTLEVYGLSKTDGSFSVSGVPFGEMLVRISFQGYETIHQKISFSKTNATVSLGTIYMKQADNDLGMVTVKQSPVQMKKDTLEISASAFKTKPNAVAEDLLKKIPGMEVDKDGNVKAQGEQVQRILVDGKRFFGDDPKMATKNLPPDVIDKIQVFDALSDQSAFTGFDDGNRIKTINITTRKDKRKGYFGKASVGFGANAEEGLYDNSFNLSRFNGDQQITLLGQGNNVNKQSFSVRDMLGSLGGGGFGGGGGNRGGGGFGGGGSSSGLLGTGSGGGLVNTWAGGANFRDNWGTKTQVSGSYFYNDQRTYREQSSYAQSLTQIQDSTIYTRSYQSSVTHNKNHRIDLNIEHQFDSSNSLIIRPNINFQQTNSESNQTNVSQGSGKGGSMVDISNSTANSTRVNSGYNASVDATFRHRFLKKGRTLSFNINLGQNTNDGSGTNNSITHTYATATKPEKLDTINQVYNSNPETKSISTTLSYTEPVGKNQLIELNYNYSGNKNTSGKHTYAYNNATGQYDLPVMNLSNIFENDYRANRLSLNYRVQNAKMNFSVGSGLQVGDRSSHNLTKDSTLTQHYVNLSPTANFNYAFSKTRNLRFFYNGRTGQPSIDQLQPVVDNSNPLNVKVGNPDLKQQFTHSFRLLYNSYDAFSGRLIFATINASVIQNDIQNATTLLPNGGQMVKPVNLSGTYNVNAFFNYGFQIKSPKSNMNLRANLSSNQSQALINGLSNYTRNSSLGGTIAWTTNLKDNFDMNFSYNSTYNMARFTLKPEQNNNTFTQTVSTEATYYTKSGWVLSTDFDYTNSTGRSAGFNTSIPLWNASLSKQMLKNKAGELKFYVFDLLNQNVSLTRQVTSTGWVDTQNKVLTRYFMISFTYNLRRFGANNQQRGGDNNPMHQMFRGGGNNRMGGGDMMRMGGGRPGGNE